LAKLPLIARLHRLPFLLELLKTRNNVAEVAEVTSSSSREFQEIILGNVGFSDPNVIFGQVLRLTKMQIGTAKMRI
jgi:hypothetical protein